MKPHRILSLILAAAMILAAGAVSAEAVSPVPGVSLTVGTVTANAAASNSVSVDITADNPSQIAGAAFTVLYNTDELTLTAVSSAFFDTFATQFGSITPPPEPFPPTSVTVGEVTYDRPVVSAEKIGLGTMIAAARIKAGSTNPVLFTLTFDVSKAFNGIYPIAIVHSIINNTAAGYSAAGEPIPMLVGAIEGEPDPALAFPPIPVASAAPGTITVNGSGVFESITLDINQPFNVQEGRYVDAAAGADWHVWFQLGTNTLVLNNMTIKREAQSVLSFGDFQWPAGTLPNHTGITATSWILSNANIGDIFSVKISEGMFLLVRIAGFTANGSVFLEMLPLGSWEHGEEPPAPPSGCGGTYSIGGQVLDANTNDPIYGVWVDVFSDSVMCGTRVMTDANGYYTASGLKQGEYRISYFPPPPGSGMTAYQEAHYCGTGCTTRDWAMAGMVTAGSNPTGIDLKLNAGCMISGTILKGSEPLGFPVWVDAWSNSTNSWSGARSNPDSTYTITGLAPAADYRITVSPYYDPMNPQPLPPEQQFMSIYWNSNGGTTNWDLAGSVPCGSTQVNFLFKEGATISGRVTSDGFSGIPNTWVSAWSNDPMSSGGTYTDASGSYTIRNLEAFNSLEGPALYTVEIYNPNYNYQQIAGVPANSTNVDFILNTGASISGRILLEESPLGGVWVEAYSALTGGWGGTVSGQNPDGSANDTGAFTISGLLPASDYIVTAWPAGYPSKKYASPIDLRYGNATGIDLVLSEGKYITGTVTGPNGPVQGVWIEAWSNSTYGWGIAQTDAGGVYKISPLPDASDYVISYWQTQGEPYFSSFYSTGGTVSDWNLAGEVDITTVSASGIDLLLTAGVSITGKVVRGTTPEMPVPGVWVEAWSETTQRWGGASTGPLGNYKIDGLIAAPDYTITVYPWNQAPAIRENVEAPSIDVNFDLNANIGKVISGTVKVGNDPIEGVWVNAWSASTGSFGYTRTGLDGSFTITDLAAAGDYQVDFFHPDYGSFTQMGVSSGSVGQFTPLSIAYSPGAIISGIIDGLTAAGWNIWVDAWSESTGDWGGAQASFNASSNVYEYVIKGLDSTVTDYIVSVNGFNQTTGTNIMTLFYDGASGTTNWTEAVKVNAADATVDDNIDFVVDLGKSISGTVTVEGVTAPNPLLAGIWVDAYSETTMSWGGAVTDPSGNYNITGLASGAGYRVSAFKEGYPTSFYASAGSTWLWDRAELVDVTGGDKSGVDITLTLGGSISGTVNDTAGKAISGVWIDIWSPTQQFGMGGFTDRLGKYKITGLLKGVTDYDVTAYPSGTNYKPITKSGKKAGDVVNFVLSSGFTFYGTVTTNGTLPYPDGAWVDIWNNNFYGWAEVSSTGLFSVKGLTDGTYTIKIWPMGSGYVPYETTNLNLVSSGTYVNSGTPMPFTLSTGLNISGTVTGSNGSGISGVFVDAWSPTGNWGSAITGTTGAYTIKGLVDASDYTVSLWSPVYPGDSRTGVSAGATGVNFTLATGGNITGTVRYNGAPVSGVWVEAYSATVQSWAGAYTASDGTYTLSGLREKTSTNVNVTDYIVTVYPLDKAIQEKSGKSVGNVVDFALTSGDSISGTILDAGGNPISGATVKFFLAGTANDGIWLNNVFTDASGGFEMKGLATGGSYNIKILKTGFVTAWYASNGGNNAVVNRVDAGVIAAGAPAITMNLATE